MRFVSIVLVLVLSWNAVGKSAAIPCGASLIHLPETLNERLEQKSHGQAWWWQKARREAIRLKLEEKIVRAVSTRCPTPESCPEDVLLAEIEAAANVVLESPAIVAEAVAAADGPSQSRMTVRGWTLFAFGIAMNALVVPIAVVLSPAEWKLPVGFAIGAITPFLFEPLVSTGRSVLQAKLNRHSNRDPDAAPHVTPAMTAPLEEIYRKIVGSLDVNQREAAGHMTGGDIAVTLKLNQAETNFRFGDRRRAAEETRDAILTIFRLPWLLPDQEGNLTTLPQSELFPAWHDKMWFADDDFRATVRKLVTDDVRFHNTTDMLDKVIERLMPPTPTIAAVKP